MSYTLNYSSRSVVDDLFELTGNICKFKHFLRLAKFIKYIKPLFHLKNSTLFNDRYEFFFSCKRSLSVGYRYFIMNDKIYTVLLFLFNKSTNMDIQNMIKTYIENIGKFINQPPLFWRCCSVKKCPIKIHLKMNEVNKLNYNF